MSNHSRGLWGYSGETSGGLALTIQSTGLGGPSAAIVLTELVELGVSAAIRIGSCSSIDPGLELETVIVVESAIGADGVSARLGVTESRPDAQLLTRLAGSGEAETATVVTTDLFYEPDQSLPGRWLERGARAVELQAAPLFALGARMGVATGCLLCVTDAKQGTPGGHIGDERLHAAAMSMGRLAVGALDG
jgi:uridine phosphorylase